jgi:P4 family phage/plasmid primase-like protien
LDENSILSHRLCVTPEIYTDFHQELLRLKGVDYHDNAYHYLVYDRLIHPRVVEDSMLGAVPGGGYDVDGKFQPLLDFINQHGGASPKGRGRPPKAQGPSPAELLQWLIEQRDKLRDCILKHAGWLAFFYTDIHHRLVAIRFRKPGTHYFTFFKPYRGSGLFGHGLFTPAELNGLQAINELLIVMEGEFNQLQLQSLVIRQAEVRGKDTSYVFSCAVGGVDNTDWEAIQRLSKRPILVHDHDHAGETWVQKARQIMAVEVCTTPTKDMDEYIRTFGDRHSEAWTAVRALIKGRICQHRLYSGTGAEFFDGKRFVPKRLGDAIMERYHLKYAADLLWVYRDGVYRADGEQAVKQEAHTLLGEQRTEGHIQETLRYIEVETYAKPPEANPDYINLRNGRLDWRTRKLSPHTPEIFDIWQLPVTYDRAATCPAITQYLNTTFTDDVIPLVEEITGYVTIPDTRFEKAVMLKGDGSNGKSVLLDLLVAFLGQENVSHEALQDLEENRFRAAELLGKLANIFADLDARALTTSSFFKTLTTGDPLDVERKFGHPFRFKNYARMLFSANKIPDSRDKTYAYYRRWIIIPFTRTFTEETGKDTDLRAKLTTPQELSGLLNLALDGLHRLFDHQSFTVPGAVKDAIAAYQRENDSVDAFSSECLVADPTGHIRKQVLYRNYRFWCVSQKLKAVDQKAFRVALKRLHPTLDEARANRGKGPWEWIGVRYVGDDWAEDLDDDPPPADL